MDDCAICTVATVMGSPYSYERVEADSRKYSRITPHGTYPAWWETYLREEGFHAQYRVGGLFLLAAFGGEIVGMQSMYIPDLAVGHVVAVDEIGVIDPATGNAEHIPLHQFLHVRSRAGVQFDPFWLGVRKRFLVAASPQVNR
jgi:hypothetical protein